MPKISGSGEWIYPRAWLVLRPDPEDQETVRGEGSVYWHVQIVDSVYGEPAAIAAAGVASPAITAARRE